MSKVGTLIVKPQSGTIDITTEVMGEMDPYCVVTVAEASLNTKVAHDQHQSPVWQDVLAFRVKDDEYCQITVFERDKFTTDDTIGSVTIPLREVYSKKSHTQTYEITNKGEVTGRIKVGLEFFPEIPQYHERTGSVQAQASLQAKDRGVNKAGISQREKGPQENSQQSNMNRGQGMQNQPATGANERQSSNLQYGINNQGAGHQGGAQSYPGPQQLGYTQGQNYPASLTGINSNVDVSGQQWNQPSSTHGSGVYNNAQLSNQSSGTQSGTFTQTGNQTQSTFTKQEYHPGPTDKGMLGPQGNIDVPDDRNQPVTQPATKFISLQHITGQNSSSVGQGHGNLLNSGISSQGQANPLMSANPVQPGSPNGGQAQMSYPQAYVSGIPGIGQQDVGLVEQTRVQGQTYGQYTQQTGGYSQAQSQYSQPSPTNYGSQFPTYSQAGTTAVNSSQYSQSGSARGTQPVSGASNTGGYIGQTYSTQPSSIQSRGYTPSQSIPQGTYTPAQTFGTSLPQSGLHSSVANYSQTTSLGHSQLQPQSHTAILHGNQPAAYSYTGGQSMGTQPTQASTGNASTAGMTTTVGGLQGYSNSSTGGYGYANNTNVMTSGGNLGSMGYQTTGSSNVRYTNK